MPTAEEKHIATLVSSIQEQFGKAQRQLERAVASRTEAAITTAIDDAKKAQTKLKGLPKVPGFRDREDSYTVTLYVDELERLIKGAEAAKIALQEA